MFKITETRETMSVRVDRNRKWFEVKLPVMKAFWKDICFRSVDDELIEKKNKNKRPKKPKKEIY